jgi:hypothetical protein
MPQQQPVEKKHQNPYRHSLRLAPRPPARFSQLHLPLPVNPTPPSPVAPIDLPSTQPSYWPQLLLPSSCSSDSLAKAWVQMPMRAAMVTAAWSPAGIALLLIPCGSKKFWEKSGISPIPSALFLFILQQFYISVLLLLSNYTLHFYIHANSCCIRSRQHCFLSCSSALFSSSFWCAAAHQQEQAESSS